MHEKMKQEEGGLIEENMSIDNSRIRNKSRKNNKSNN
jgi:hypothetical protein